MTAECIKKKSHHGTVFQEQLEAEQFPPLQFKAWMCFKAKGPHADFQHSVEMRIVFLTTQLRHFLFRLFSHDV